MSQSDVKTFDKTCNVEDCDRKQTYKSLYCKRHEKGDFRCTSCPPKKKLQALYGTIYEVANKRKLTKCKKHALLSDEQNYVWDNNFSNKYGKGYFTFDETFCIFGPIHELPYYNKDGELINDIDFMYATHGLTRVRDSKLFCSVCAEVLRKINVDITEIIELTDEQKQSIEHCEIDEKFVIQLYKGIKDSDDITKFVDQKYEEYDLTFAKNLTNGSISDDSDSDSGSDDSSDDSIDDSSDDNGDADTE